jgi:CBS domain-containing protein
MPKSREVMTPDPVCVEPNESVTHAAQIMRQEDVGSLPVVEDHSSRRLIGIITDRDIVVKVVAEGEGVERATVRDAMTANPASVRENDDVEEAVRAMAERQVRRMPVVDAEGRLSGIIAQADVATRMNRDNKTGELVEAISEKGTARR